ncbi:MAG: helix-turn-helix transcriptional regulator, partial [Rhodococcus sp. (in: high G+C Gram-positive bacteria)]
YRRSELARFLRACRERTSPVDAGLIDCMPPRRRIRGLRRQEVAELAGVGMSWYTWLEQGRDITLTIEVARSLVQAFGLSSDEATYLYSLGGLTESPVDGLQRDHAVDLPSDKARASDRCGSSPSELFDVRLVVDGLDRLYPAYAINRYWEVVAANAHAQRELGVRVGTNCMVRFFTEAGRQSWYGRTDLAGRVLVGRYRQQVARYPYDSRLQDTVTALMNVPEFRTLWERHEVIASLPGTISYRAGGSAAPREYRTIGLTPTTESALSVVLNVPVDDPS